MLGAIILLENANCLANTSNCRISLQIFMIAIESQTMKIFSQIQLPEVAVCTLVR